MSRQAAKLMNAPEKTIFSSDEEASDNEDLPVKNNDAVDSSDESSPEAEETVQQKQVSNKNMLD
jgi:hypothetical protein